MMIIMKKNLSKKKVKISMKKLIIAQKKVIAKKNLPILGQRKKRNQRFLI